MPVLPPSMVTVPVVRVPWLEPGVGAVATQSFVEVSYGPLGLALMKAGKTPAQALTALGLVAGEFYGQGTDFVISNRSVMDFSSSGPLTVRRLEVSGSGRFKVHAAGKSS